MHPLRACDYPSTNKNNLCSRMMEELESRPLKIIFSRKEITTKPRSPLSPNTRYLSTLKMRRLTFHFHPYLTLIRNDLEFHENCLHLTAHNLKQKRKHYEFQYVLRPLKKFKISDFSSIFPYTSSPHLILQHYHYPRFQPLLHTQTLPGNVAW